MPDVYENEYVYQGDGGVSVTMYNEGEPPAAFWVSRDGGEASLMRLVGPRPLPRSATQKQRRDGFAQQFYNEDYKRLEMWQKHCVNDAIENGWQEP